jgi:hypothetical protein
MSKRALCLLACLAATAASQGVLADEFLPGQLLVSYNNYSGGANAVCTVNPTSGALSTVWTTPSGAGQNLGDIAYSASAGAAYVVVNPGSASSSIVKLSPSPQQGYTATTFLAGLNDVNALATDAAGNLYFDQKDPNSQFQQIWKANPQGVVTAVTSSPTPFDYFFEPKYMAISPDGSSLYVTVQPSNRLDVVSLASGALRNIASGNVGFPAGITFDGSGDLLVARHLNPTPALDDIATVSPQTGAAATYLQDSSWMPFLPSGFWEGMAYDGVDGDVFAEKGNLLYGINGGLQSQLVDQFVGEQPVGLAVVVGTPEPSTFALLAAGLLGWAVVARRRRRV